MNWEVDVVTTLIYSYLLYLFLCVVLRSVVTPESSLVKQGTMVLFTCLVYSNSEDDPVELTWLYPPELADTLVVFGSSLIISSVMVQANVTCVVTQNGTGLSTRTSATITIGKVKSLKN